MSNKDQNMTKSVRAVANKPIYNKTFFITTEDFAKIK